MKKIIVSLVAIFLFMNMSSAEVYRPHEVAIISDAAGKNTFPERILMYEEIADIVHSYLYPNSDSADQLQEVDIDSVSLLVYTEVPQYCVRIIICNDPLAYATIYIDADTLEVIDITPKDYPGTLTSAMAENSPMAAEGLQEWDVQENEVIQMMREELIGQHENRVCWENGEEWHPLNDGYNPDDYYSYLCFFNAYVNEYGAYREWYCYAFYLNMPYSGWHSKVDSPSGKEYSLGPIYKLNSIVYQKDDDIRAAREAIEDHMDLLSAVHPSLSETAEYSFTLNLDRESRAPWTMNYRVIPLTLLLHTENEDLNFDDLFVVIQLIRKENSYDREYYWRISLYTEKVITEYVDSLIPSEVIPKFSNDAIFQVYIPRL